MPSSFTVNKNIEMPSSGMYVNAWAAPVNADWALIDTCLGGTTSISVTGVAGPTVALTTTEYQPPNIEFSGTLSANLAYFIPAGVGGIWSVGNATGGAFILTFAIAAGNSIQLPANTRTLIVSDGVGIAFANDTTFPQLSGEIANSQVPASAVTQYQSALVLSASQIASGTIANARLPNAASMPGVTIAADPGTVPSGPAGAIFYYY